MFQLFDFGPDVAQPILKQGQWRYIRDGLKRNLNTIWDFYRTYPTAVGYDHFLVRLLQSISVPKSLPLERYYDNVESLVIKISQAMNMTSPTYKGDLFDGVFYGRGCKEVLVSLTGNLNLSTIDRDWQDLMPVKVLTHPVTSLGMDLPDGSRDGNWGVVSQLDTLAVILIDIPMLAVQYRQFRIEEERLHPNGGDGDMRSIVQFIRMYVLPNMLPTHLDQVLFNRLYGLVNEVYLEPNRNKHPFAMPDYTKKLDDAMTEMLIWISHSPRDFQGILKSFPAITGDSLWEGMMLPEFVPTRQIVWAMFLSRLKCLSFLFEMLDDDARSRNGYVITKLVREISYLQNGNIMEQVLPRYILADVYRLTKDIVSITLPKP